MINSQIYLNVANPHVERVVNDYYDKGYLLIQSVDITSKKKLLTFEKMSNLDHKPDSKTLKAFKLDSSDEIPDHLLEEVFKK